MLDLAALKAVLDEWDAKREPFTESELSSALRGLSPLKDKTESLPEWCAEVAAFAFFEPCYSAEESPAANFAPAFVFPAEDGTVKEYPSPSLVTVEALNYWADRARDANHPILKARYSGLVWDFSKRVTGQAAHIEMARMRIDAVVQMAEKNSHRFEVKVISKLGYALSLALSLGDTGRVEKVRDAILAYEGKIAQDQLAGLWGYSFEWLLMNRRVALTTQQKEKILREMAERLARVCAACGEPGYNPNAPEKAARLLADYYRQEGREEEVSRALLMWGAAVQMAAVKQDPLVASHRLQLLQGVYRDYGLREQADAVLSGIRELGPRVRDSLKPVLVEVPITKEQMTQHVASMVQGGLEAALERIADHYLPNRDQTENSLKHIVSKHPIGFLFPTSILDHEGRAVASVGGYEDDLEGNLVHHMSQNMSFEAVFLRNVMHGLRDAWGLTAEGLVAYLYRSPVFGEDRKGLVRNGLKAYLGGDAATALHFLVPQVEGALRLLVERLGGKVYKPNRFGGFDLRTLDDLLRDEKLEKLFQGEDVPFYMRVLFTDRRGWNLRNRLCHGMLSEEFFGMAVADRVLHALLVLAQVREKPRGEPAEGSESPAPK